MRLPPLMAAMEEESVIPTGGTMDEARPVEEKLRGTLRGMRPTRPPASAEATGTEEPVPTAANGAAGGMEGAEAELPRCCLLPSGLLRPLCPPPPPPNAAAALWTEPGVRAGELSGAGVRAGERLRTPPWLPGGP